MQLLEVKALGPDHVLNHMVQIAEGAQWRAVIADTVEEAMQLSSLRYCGVTVTEPQLEDGANSVGSVYMETLLSAVAAMEEYGIIPKAFPWRTAGLLTKNSDLVKKTLGLMKEEWQLVSWLEQVLPPCSWIRKSISHVSWQWYRETMCEAETCCFNADMVARRGVLLPLVMSYMGNCTSLLSTIPVERMFCDLRDAERRHGKTYSTCASNLQAVSVKSAASRTPGWDHITLTDQDWSAGPQGDRKHPKTVRQEVYTPVGVEDQSGLNYHKLCSPTSKSPITGPALFSHGEMTLLPILLELAWERDLDQFITSADLLWTSALVPLSSKTIVRINSIPYVVLSAGPFCLRVWPLQEVSVRNKDWVKG